MSDKYDEFRPYLEDRWKFINKSAWDGYPIRHLVQSLEDDLDWLRGEAEKENAFDKFNPLAYEHNRQRMWIERTIQSRDHYVRNWRSEAELHYNKLFDNVNESKKLVLLTHGAALLGSLTALGTLQNNQYVSSFLVVAIGALVGFLVAIIGQIIWLENFGDVIAKIRNQNIEIATIRRLRSYSRYWEKRWKREVMWSIRLTYLSVIVFPLYAFFAILLAIYS
ncbi:hypothetical protein [Hoeflea olei]|uniref:hypothetical protein n=1 Tax=Hoeflea olei TaxID=1480615 RepID=UPI0011127D46|nr:hypothetical protein [Hoeflea olei]